MQTSTQIIADTGLRGRAAVLVGSSVVAILENSPLLAGMVAASDDTCIGDSWDGEVFTPPAPPPFNRQSATLAIDDAVAAIYGRFTRFQLEYTEREIQAQAYKDADYAGAVPPRVSEFSTPAGMPPQDAADLILAQAVSLRDAQGALSALRMRKYEVLRASTDEAARTAAAEILASIATVGAQVS
ncbi:MAG: hypothetical protein PHU77_00430 [Simplicispira sp.]|nr:hypothetical protein [Simplicispira sp.]